MPLVVLLLLSMTVVDSIFQVQSHSSMTVADSISQVHSHSSSMHKLQHLPFPL
jgi:hypothetical protein